MSSQTSAAAAARVDELTEEIRALNEHIEDRSKLLTEKKREHDIAGPGRCYRKGGVQRCDDDYGL